MSETEKYDVSLYTVPYAESVTAELASVFYRPVFRIEDLTLDIVRARTAFAEDAGDSEGPRISLCVLCGDILAEIKAKGVSPERVYGELSSLPRVR